MLDQTSTVSGPGPAAEPEARRQPAHDQVTLTQSADDALQSLSTLYTAVDASLTKRMQENPYATLAVAAGVGFVLGGGLRSPVGQLLMRLSVKTLAPPLVNAALHSVVERAQSALGQTPAP